jgi:uncharacterized protein (DUF433 family)
MQTTLRIDDELYREAKAEAARQGMTLTRFLQEGLRLRLQKARSTGAGSPVRIRSYRKGEPFSFNDRELKEIANREQELADIAAHHYLTNVPGVCGGRTIIAGTRIGVHDVMGLIVNGAGVEEVQESFPDLTRAQIYECLSYYEDHRTEIDALVAEQMSEPLA